MNKMLMNKLNDVEFALEVCRQLDTSLAFLPPAINRGLDNSRQAALLAAAPLKILSNDDLLQSEKLDLSSFLPAEIEDRLDQIRHRAVARFEELQEQKQVSTGFALAAWIRTQFAAFNFSASAGMLATACVLVTAISIFYANSRPGDTLTLEAEIGLVASADDIELYENLEFYLWLAENEALTL